MVTNAEFFVLFCFKARPVWELTVLLTLILDLHVEDSEVVVCRCGESPCWSMLWQTGDDACAMVTRPASLSSGIECLAGAVDERCAHVCVCFRSSSRKSRDVAAMPLIVVVVVLSLTRTRTHSLLLAAQAHKYELTITCTHFMETFYMKSLVAILARREWMTMTWWLKVLGT